MCLVYISLGFTTLGKTKILFFFSQQKNILAFDADVFS